uniref:DENN/MADD domain containing 4B n=1 Tax=Tetraodon nigroviridis TaxID=99883 RepID=H3C7X0_TETNG
RGGLAAKLQHLLTPTRHRASVRRAASVDERRAQQRLSRKAQVAETLLKAKEKLAAATSESSLSVGSDLDLTDTPTPAHPSRRSWDASQEGAGLEVLMSSCSLCRSCSSLVYDEEIMAGWTSDDSNLNSCCPFCGASFVPFLTRGAVRPPTPRQRPEPRGRQSSRGTPPPPALDPPQRLHPSHFSGSTPAGGLGGRGPQVTVAYLSPLVLRKELESLLENEGEAVLARPQFLDNHSIVFWNLLWYFQRLRLPSNLLQLVQVSRQPPSPSRQSRVTDRWLALQAEGSALRVRLLWDTLTPDLEQWPPLYVLWRIHSKSPERAEAPERLRLAFLEEVLRWVGMNEVHKAVTLFLDTLDRQPGSPRTQRSLYRELLFLTLAAMGQDHVGTPAFDKKYKAAYSRLGATLGREELRRKRAQPPGAKAVDCRRSFHPPLQC